MKMNHSARSCLVFAGLDSEGWPVCLVYDLGQGGGGDRSRPECHLHRSSDWPLHHDLSPHLPLLQAQPREGPQSLRSSERSDLPRTGADSPGERQLGLHYQSLVQRGGQADKHHQHAGTHIFLATFYLESLSYFNGLIH